MCVAKLYLRSVIKTIWRTQVAADKCIDNKKAMLICIIQLLSA